MIYFEITKIGMCFGIGIFLGAWLTDWAITKIQTFITKRKWKRK